METRVACLETHFDYLRNDVSEIKASLSAINVKLADAPTKCDLLNYWVVSFAISVSVFGIAVGAIVGGLSWIHG